MTKDIERQLIEIIAVDRIDRPISSMSGKLKRKKPKLAKAVDLSTLNNVFDGQRVYARVEDQDTLKARGMKEGIAQFKKEYARHGSILQGMIEEKRDAREVNLYFGMQDGCKLTSEDYMGVMRDLGFTEAASRGLYQELMGVSRKLARARDEERSILIG